MEVIITTYFALMPTEKLYFSPQVFTNFSHECRQQQKTKQQKKSTHIYLYL